MGKFRLRTPQFVASHIEDVAVVYGIKRFVFAHDNLAASRHKLAELCWKLGERQLGVTWNCAARIDALDGEILEQMRSVGCESIFLGIESGSQRMQETINKRLKLHQVIPTISQISNNGLSFTASFIMGFPDERIEDLIATINLAMEMSLAGVATVPGFEFNLAIPLPGSPLYEEYSQEISFDGHSSVCTELEITEEETDLIIRYPGVFAPFYYYPTRNLHRSTLVRLKDFVLNLLPMQYTVFMLLRDATLDFPACLFRKGSLNCFSASSNSEPRPMVSDVGVFLSNLFVRMGLPNHPIHEVIKFDCAVFQSRQTTSDASPSSVERFNFDVLTWVHQAQTQHFGQLPDLRLSVSHRLSFSNRQGHVCVSRLESPATILPTLNIVTEKGEH